MEKKKKITKKEKKEKKKKHEKKQVQGNLWRGEKEEGRPYPRMVRRGTFEVDSGKVTQKCGLMQNENSITVVLSIFQ